MTALACLTLLQLGCGDGVGVLDRGSAQSSGAQPSSDAREDGGVVLDEGEGEPLAAPPGLSLEPALATPGQAVRALGQGFSADVQCFVQARAAACDFVSPSELTLRVPPDLPLEACRQNVSVSVEAADGGPLGSAPLQLQQPAPRVELGSREVRAGEALAWALDASLPVRIQVESGEPADFASLPGALDIPLELEPGERNVVIEDRCQQTSIQITVLPPPERIEAGPSTLAADGIAILGTAFVSPDHLLAVQIGDQALDPADGAQVQWLGGAAPAGDASGERPARLAVRAPSLLERGTTELRLITKYGELSWPVEAIETSGPYPESPLGILWPSRGASGVFPISTIAPGLLVVDSEAGALTRSEFQYRIWLSSAGREDCPVARAGKGILYGFELLSAGGVSHPIEGEYELHSEANRVHLSIDRAASGGQLESYVGGWVNYPENADPGQLRLPPPSERAHPPALVAEGAPLVLTSELTGRQLLISRRVVSEEESSTIRACLQEIP